MKKFSEIRQEFLDFFASKGHKIVPSAPVVPYDDPTLLFVNAGMNQFKDIFLGNVKAESKRVADTQKCIRVSGKHNDLEEVGHDGYHHTFFEMLGNWSFGDYYKKEAIKWAWELLTEVWKLDKKKLWATVYKDDEESLNFWRTETDIDQSHVLKFGAKDNFWEMGDTGPCGPCSEIHYDFSQNGCKASDINAGNPDVMEIWNLVFIQFNRDSNGKLHELPQKHVDTGMGFERIVRVLQNKSSNYETDIFLPLINELINITGKEYSLPAEASAQAGGKYEAPMNVIADHIRTLAFAIGDGAIPSNEGRGYVLRRVLRRAARYGRNLDMHKPFIYGLVDVLVKSMGRVFPEIAEKREFIKEVIKGEEESFNETLDRGLVLFNEEIERMKNTSVGAEHVQPKIFSGEVAFKLHDTYGFPIDLTQLMAKEKGFGVDVKKFDKLMEEQKQKSKKARKDELGNIIQPDGHQYFEGFQEYDPYSIDKNNYVIDTDIIACYRGEWIDRTPYYSLLPRHLPLYIESGGQVNDAGKIYVGNLELDVIRLLKSGHLHVQSVYDVDNLIYRNDNRIKIFVDYPRRQSIQRNHSATHLVHEALRRVLGSHVKQMGSYLDDKLLRFDFPHFHKLKPQEITDIEQIVNDKVGGKIKVYAEVMPFDKANKIPNVKKLFGEKYGDEVRVVFIDENFSVEFCGGTHVKDTTDIGLFKIVKEESVSSGTRRIFARTGKGIIDYINERISEIEKISSELPEKYYNNFKAGIENFRKDFKNADSKDTKLLKTLIEYQDSTINSLIDTREKYLEEKRQIEKELAKQKVKQAGGYIDELISNSAQINGFKLVSEKVDADNLDELKEIGDKLREKLQSGVGLLYSIVDDKVILVAVVTDNLIKEKKLSAGKIAGDVAKILGGGGGGKPHLATAGGKDVSKIDEAIGKLKSIVEGYIK
ncbi:MAG: alanine--tRNA ligase [Chlorobi bacterium]|nr:alanine--tRNA ligase [Chlorobiota bacterium]MCI0715584.1 alanine--tRNA ligase [Chlorobiota bacterium]